MPSEVAPGHGRLFVSFVIFCSNPRWRVTLFEHGIADFHLIRNPKSGFYAFVRVESPKIEFEIALLL
jgi:hypothetical protein